MPKINFIFAVLCLAVLVTLASAVVWAQVTIQSNGSLVPEEKVNVLYQTTFRVVAQELNIRDIDDLRFPVTLVLGDTNERVVGDEVLKVYTIYMEHWDEAKFALAASRIAVQHLVTEERKRKIVTEILRRSNQIAPVSLQASQMRR